MATNTIHALGTTFRILDELKTLDGAGVTYLADSLDLPKSTVHSHLATLKEHGFVIKDDESYEIGLRFLEFGEHRRHSMKLYTVGKEEIDHLAEETGELANIMVEENGKGRYLYFSMGENALDLGFHGGAESYLHATALGKVILAHMQQEKVDAIIDRHGLPRKTKNTVTDRDDLMDDLEAIRERGYSLNEGESTEGIRCVGVPILDMVGTPLGAISIAAPMRRMPDTRFEQEVPDLLLGAANAIELKMQHM